MKGRRTHNQLNKDFSQAVMPKEMDLRRSAVAILGGGILLFYLFLVILQQQVCDTLIVENGQTSFTATFEELSRIVPSNADRSIKNLLDENDIRISVEILREDGSMVACYENDGLRIGTNVYDSSGAMERDEGVVDLVKGETYTIEYWAFLANNDQIESLSFALYRETGQMLPEAGALSLLTVLLLIMMWLAEQPARSMKDGGGEKMETVRDAARRIGGHPAVYVVIFLCVSGIFLISTPRLNELEEERTAFSDAYALSNTILGKEAADEEDYVYIEESGIRSMGNMEDAQALHHFWTNWEDGNERESGATSAWYPTSGRMASVITLLDALAIAAARMLKLPYQMVYLSGIFVNYAIGFGVFLIALFLCSGGREMEDDLFQAGGIASHSDRGTSDDGLPKGKGRRSGHKKHVRHDNAAGRITYTDPSSLLLLAMFLLPSMMRGLLSYRGFGVIAAIGILIVLLTARHVRYRDLVYKIALGISAVLCAAGLVRVLLAGGNVLTAAVRSFAANADAWLYGLVCSFPEQLEGAEFLFLCLLGLVLLLLLMARRPAGGETWKRGMKKVDVDTKEFRSAYGDEGECAMAKEDAGYGRHRATQSIAWRGDSADGRLRWILLATACVLALLLSGEPVTTESGRIVLSGLPSAVLLPLLLIPAVSGNSAVPKNEMPFITRLRSAEAMRRLWEILLLLITFLGFRCVA